MLHWIYITIAAIIAGLVLVEIFSQKRWQTQVALALVLLPLVLRILHIK